jgi:hypothetical protein
MKRTHGLVPLAILHHVTAAIGLLAMLGSCLNPGDKHYLGTVVLLCAFAFLSVIVRRAWASIDGGSQGMSPGKAQGFLWIPFFNFYWVFPAFVSLATETNAKAVAENIPEAKMTRGFGLVIAILFSVTTLTEAASSHHPFFAWMNFLVYATYVGFEVTYIWQIKASAEAFDAKCAPALSEPNKMPTVGVAGIIFGSGLVALLLFNLNVNFLTTPESIEQRLKAKGYTVQIEHNAILSGFRTEEFIQNAGGREISYIKVYKGEKRVAGVFFATGSFTAESEKTLAGRLGTRTLRNGDKLFFKAYNRETSQENLDIDAWLNSL